MTNFIATLLIVVVDLQQIHIKRPIRSSIAGARDFAWYGTQKRTRVALGSLFLLFFELTSSKDGY